MFLQQIECLRRENNRPIKRAERVTTGWYITCSICIAVVEWVGSKGIGRIYTA
jgi:hypothetical protein